ncbi:hypothetical protein BaRGS_00004215 [Batillaria attramentaria]|uniref:Uncharacterized protein n=1 Tax=Batillaria attramentaria TaxID=370345 RepID=A0ABD0M0B7_9CAEN
MVKLSAAAAAGLMPRDNRGTWLLVAGVLGVRRQSGFLRSTRDFCCFIKDVSLSIWFLESLEKTLGDSDRLRLTLLPPTLSFPREVKFHTNLALPLPVELHLQNELTRGQGPQSYEWALEAMKYVASMKMEHCASASGLDKLLRSLEQYLREHPPLCEDSFVHMIDSAQRLHNEKLLEQCRVAKARCQETYHLLLLRQNTLQRARDQLVVEQGQNGVGENLATSPNVSGRDVTDGVLSTRENNSVTGMGGVLSKTPAQSHAHKDTKRVVDEDDFPVWEPRTTSTPGREDDGSWVDTYGLRRPRSSSSRSSGSGGTCASSLDASHDRSAMVIANPLADKLSPSPTSPTSSFPNRSSNSSQGEEDHDFKTPKGPVRLQLSRTISNPNTPVTTPSPIGVSMSASAISAGRHQKKMLKRASTAPVPMIASPIIYEDQEVVDTQGRQLRDRRSGKTLSMMTGSSESLPR